MLGANYAACQDSFWHPNYTDDGLATSLEVQMSALFIHGKGHPRTYHKGPETEYRCCCTFSLTSALDGGAWLTPRFGHFKPQKRAPGTHFIGGWVGQGAGMDGCVKSLPTGFRSPDRTARYATPAHNVHTWAVEN